MVESKVISLSGTLADPFLIAKAMITPDSIVVTRERYATRDERGNVQGALKFLTFVSILKLKLYLQKNF